VIALAGFALVMACVIVLAMWHTLRERVAQVGWPRLIVRWFLGVPWHGGHITDAGFHRPGVKVLTKVGHARKFWHRPAKHRFAIRTTETLTPLAAVWGWFYYRLWTEIAVCAAGAGGLAYLGWRGWRSWQRRVWRRSWLYPLHKTLAPMLDVPVAVSPQSWLQLAPDRSRATIELPPGYRSQRDMERIEEAVSATLALEAPDVAWDRSGARPVVVFTKSATPRRVKLADIIKAIEAAGADEIVLGLGKRGQPVSMDLFADSPHIALSVGSGGGKTRTARFIGAQALHKGANVIVLNIRQIGHNWARGLPNTAMAKRPEDIAAMLLWLDAERERREAVADAAADDEDNVHASVGPRLVVIFEEMNLTVPKLRRICPEAVEALANLFFAGRQVRINIVAIAQRLSAQTTGGGDARESIGCRLMGRYQVQTWKMLAAEHKMPEPSDKPGRLQVITSVIHECQVADITAAEAKQLALSGTVVPCSADMPLRCLVPGVPGDAARPQITAPPAETGPLYPVTDPPGTPPAVDGMSLRDVASLQVVPMSQGALKQARKRDPSFPQPAGYESQTALYDPEAIHAWHERTRRRQWATSA
jgi:hypothetical protein